MGPTKESWLFYNSNVTMVYGTFNYSITTVNGLYEATNLTAMAPKNSNGHGVITYYNIKTYLNII
jgi:hypothetical protein